MVALTLDPANVETVVRTAAPTVRSNLAAGLRDGNAPLVTVLAVGTTVSALSTLAVLSRRRENGMDKSTKIALGLGAAAGLGYLLFSGSDAQAASMPSAGTEPGDDTTYVTPVPPGGGGGASSSTSAGDQAVLSQYQTQLRALGYTGANGTALSVDGRWGSSSRAAASAFQRDQGLPVTGMPSGSFATRLQALYDNMQGGGDAGSAVGDALDGLVAAHSKGRVPLTGARAPRMVFSGPTTRVLLRSPFRRF